MKMKNLLISFVCLLGLISPISKDIDNNELSIVFNDSIKSEITKQNLSISYSNIYNKVADGVVSVLNFTKVNGKDKLDSFGSAFAYYQDNHLFPYIYFISNNHVVDGASSIYLVTNYNQRVKAEVIGVDKTQDCSVLRAYKSSFTKTIPILDLYRNDKNEFVDPLVGDDCFVIGTPADVTFRNTLNVGIVSGVQRIVVQENDNIFKQDHAIQLDCAVNPGNSGGPLFNKDGKVIGVNTMKLQTENGYELDSLNFSLPICDMYATAEKIRTTYSSKLTKVAYSTRVSLSNNTRYVSIRDLSLKKRISYGVEGLNKGIVLLNNDQTLGLNKYSVITKIDNYDIDNVVLFRRFLFNASVGQKVTVYAYKHLTKLDTSLSSIDVNLISISMNQTESEE